MMSNPSDESQTWNTGDGARPAPDGRGPAGQEQANTDAFDTTNRTQPLPRGNSRDAGQNGQPWGGTASGQDSHDARDRHDQQDAYGQPVQAQRDIHATQDPYGHQDAYAQQGTHGTQVPYGQQDSYGQQDAYGQQDPYGQQYETAPGYGPQSTSYGSGPEGGSVATSSGTRRFGTGTLITGMALAALVGGGVAAGTTGLMNSHQTTAASSSGQNNATTIVNNSDSVNAVTAAAKKASPSVVTISVSGSDQSGTGSGVILDNDGHILTNTHVVTLDGSTSNATAEVQLSDGSAHQAKVVGTDPTSDLAVLKIDPNGLNLTPASLGDSSKLNVGDVAVAIGSPLGLNGTVTDGIVSNLNRTISVASSAAPEGGDSSDGSGSDSPFQFEYPDKNGKSQTTQSNSTISLGVLQTDAAINPGNSGGALVNSQGQVIGINVAIASAGSNDGSSSSDSSGNIGVGFSIPIDYAKRVSQEIIENGSASHGYLGASVGSSPANDDSSKSFSDGAVIKQVSSGGPAADAGLKQGDVVTELNGTHISDAESLTAGVRQAKAGDTVTVKYQRGNSEQTAEVKLGDAKDAQQR